MSEIQFEKPAGAQAIQGFLHRHWSGWLVSDLQSGHFIFDNSNDGCLGYNTGKKLIDNGKPVERQGRKAMGLPLQSSHDCQAAEKVKGLLPLPSLVFSQAFWFARREVTMKGTLEKQKTKYPLNCPRFCLWAVPIAAVAYFTYYLIWRAAATFNPAAIVFSWVLWFAEAFGVISYILFAWMTRNVSPLYRYIAPAAGITVDVFVPTYNEDLDILEATLVGCRRITYPHRTYLLDDGNRPEARQLAQRMGCSYISRPTHEHAKAGNINYALTQTQGEFIVILDADMVPQPDFIHRTLGYFTNPKLAFIQLPQEFYNKDSIQHKSGDWHEQSLFFRVIQPGKNYTNSAFWCGSPSIVRRTALEDIGGVAVETITEDIHTSVRIHSRGWQSLFLNEELAYGIAPQTIKSFLLQRLRWAQGTMQLYRSKESPLWIRGLTIQQRLSYLSSFLAYFESFQKLILILLPVFIILFNVFPMRVDMGIFLLYWIPYFALNVLANQVGGRGYFRYFQTEKYNILKMVVFIQATLALFFSRNLIFKVTPKSVDTSVYKNERAALRTYMVILGLAFGAILYGLVHLIAWKAGTVQLEMYLVVLIWAFYNSVVILIAIWEILRKRHERKQYRFPVKLKCDICEQGSLRLLARAQLDDLSIAGAGLTFQKCIPDPPQLSIQFNVSENKQLTLPIGKIECRRETPRGIFVGITFGKVTGDQRERLFEYLFVDLPAQWRLQRYRSKPQWSMPALPEMLYGELASSANTRPLR